MTETWLEDDVLLSTMPHFIAVNYDLALHAHSPEEQIRQAAYTYDLLLRMLSILMVSQYLSFRPEEISDPYLNELLLQKFPHLTLDTWQQLFFTTLKAYDGKQDLLFVPQLYNLYWDSSTLPHRRRTRIENTFARLTQIAASVQANRALPKDESAWVGLATETMTLLRSILKEVSFLKSYDLVRVLACDEESYTLELNKGLGKSIHRYPLIPYSDLTRGWFYLRKETQEFLLLHPLMIFWEGQVAPLEALKSDTGVYDRSFYDYDQLQYFLTSLRTTVTDAGGFKEFVALLYGTIEEEKRRRQNLEKLTWWQLRDLCADISSRRMSAVRLKYRRELYLSRRKAREAIDRFLQSEQRCFVLVGKAGVGKSNFLLALEDALRQSRDDACFLMYDGTHFDTTHDITEVVSQDFSKLLTLGGKRVRQVWSEIAKIDGIRDRLVILCVDAINESAKAKDLLRQLNDLAQDPWPWLKIVVSCRPETWQVIKHGVRLSEGLYYQEQRADLVAIELEPFSFSERLGPFTRQELPEAFDKYRDYFHLQSSFDSLSPELRLTLQEPFHLWLVAKTYEGRPIPGTVKTTELVEGYIRGLIDTERLQADSLRLLEKRLVPLMIKNGGCTNAIAPTDIDDAGDDLYQMIYSEQVLSDGYRMNQAFTNLVDNEILVRIGEGYEQRITFKYERFYEYFVGRALLQSLGSEEQWEVRYRQWLAELSEVPYLWGAVKTCLLEQLKSLPPETSAKLCAQLTRGSERRMADILVVALSEYGRDDISRVNFILRKALLAGSSVLNNLLSRKTASLQCPQLKRVAIEAATQLGMEDVLELALTDRSPSVRAVAIRSAFVYWRRQPPAALGLLSRLMKRSRGFLGLPALHVLEASIGLSLLVLFEDFHNPQTKTTLQSLWRDEFERLLWFDRRPGHTVSKTIKTAVRTVMVRLLAVAFVLRTARETPALSTISVAEAKHFYRRDSNLETRRRVASQLVASMQQEGIRVKDVRELILSLAEERDFVITWLAIMLLQRLMMSESSETAKLLKEVSDRAITVERPGPFCYLVPATVFSISTASTLAQGREVFLDLACTYLDQFRGIWWSDLQMRRTTAPDQLCFFETGATRDVSMSPIVRHYVDNMVAQRDYDWIIDLIQEITGHAVELGHLRLTFSILEEFGDVEEPRVREAVIELLARIRVYYPEQCDDFLLQADLEEVLGSAVRKRMPSESLGDLLNLRTLRFWNEAILRGGSSDFWRKLVQNAGQWVESTSVEQCFTVMFEFFANEIAGEAIFTEAPV